MLRDGRAAGTARLAKGARRIAAARATTNLRSDGGVRRPNARQRAAGTAARSVCRENLPRRGADKPAQQFDKIMAIGEGVWPQRRTLFRNAQMQPLTLCDAIERMMPPRSGSSMAVMSAFPRIARTDPDLQRHRGGASRHGQGRSAAPKRSLQQRYDSRTHHDL
jgi:hypothetical protein